MRPSTALAQSRAARANSPGRIPVRPWSAALFVLLALSCAHAPDKISFEQAEQEQFPPELRREALLAKPGPMLASAGDFLPRLALTAWPSGTGMAGGGNCSSPSASCSAASFTTTGTSTAATFTATAAAGSNGFQCQTTGCRYSFGSWIMGESSGLFVNGSGALYPLNTNTNGLGQAANRWTTVFSGNVDVNGTTAPTNGLYITGTNEVGLQAVSAKVLACNGSTGACSASSGQFVSKVGGAGLVSIGSTLIGQFTIDATVHNSGADTTEDTLWTYSLPGASLDVTGRSIRITAWGDGVSTADVTTVRCYFGATVVLSKVLTASQANTWRATFEVTRTGATTQNASGTLANGGTATSFVQSNATPAETLSGAVTIKCTGQRATSSVANSVRQLYALGEFIN